MTNHESVDDVARDLVRALKYLRHEPGVSLKHGEWLERFERAMSRAPQGQEEAPEELSEWERTGWMAEVLEMIRERLEDLGMDMKGCPPMMYDDAITSLAARLGKLADLKTWDDLKSAVQAAAKDAKSPFAAPPQETPMEPTAGAEPSPVSVSAEAERPAGAAQPYNARFFGLWRGGERRAQVVEFGNGKCVVSWPTSTIVYDSLALAEAVHITHMGGRGEPTEFRAEFPWLDEKSPKACFCGAVPLDLRCITMGYCNAHSVGVRVEVGQADHGRDTALSRWVDGDISAGKLAELLGVSRAAVRPLESLLPDAAPMEAGLETSTPTPSGSPASPDSPAQEMPAEIEKLCQVVRDAYQHTDPDTAYSLVCALESLWSRVQRAEQDADTLRDERDGLRSDLTVANHRADSAARHRDQFRSRLSEVEQASEVRLKIANDTLARERGLLERLSEVEKVRGGPWYRVGDGRWQCAVCKSIIHKGGDNYPSVLGHEAGCPVGAGGILERAEAAERRAREATEQRDELKRHLTDTAQHLQHLINANEGIPR